MIALMAKKRWRDKRIPVPMQDALKEFLRESGLGPRLKNSDVFRAFGQALGATLSKRAHPVRFQSGNLTVEVESAAHMHELANFSGEHVRRKANKILGAERIARVDFKLKR